MTTGARKTASESTSKTSVARTADGLKHQNTLVLRTVKLYFQRFPGTGGTDEGRGIASLEYTVKVDDRVVDKGKTATDGSLTLYIPAGKKVILEILGTEYLVKANSYIAGHETVEGEFLRLHALGYYSCNEAGSFDNFDGPDMSRPLIEFQIDTGRLPEGVERRKEAAVGKDIKNEFGE
jgi:hypothetical protein